MEMVITPLAPRPAEDGWGHHVLQVQSIKNVKIIQYLQAGIVLQTPDI